MISWEYLKNTEIFLLKKHGIQSHKIGQPFCVVIGYTTIELHKLVMISQLENFGCLDTYSYNLLHLSFQVYVAK